MKEIKIPTKRMTLRPMSDYSSNLGLLQKFLSEAYESRIGDSHALASARIKREFAYIDQTKLPAIQTHALELLHAHTREMEEKYGGR